MYEFNVCIWSDSHDQWYYSLIQSFDETEDETLAYGVCDTQQQAAHCVSVELSGLQLEG